MEPHFPKRTCCLPLNWKYMSINMQLMIASCGNRRTHKKDEISLVHFTPRDPYFLQLVKLRLSIVLSRQNTFSIITVKTKIRKSMKKTFKDGHCKLPNREDPSCRAFGVSSPPMSGYIERPSTPRINERKEKWRLTSVSSWKGVWRRRGCCEWELIMVRFLCRQFNYFNTA